MKLKQFIEALLEAGWQPTLDANSAGITELHNQLFPTVSALEQDVQNLIQDFKHLATQYDELKEKHDELVESLYWDD